MNDAYCQITGRSREELQLLALDDITPAGDQPWASTAQRQLIERRMLQTEFRVVRPNQSIRWVVASLTRVDDESGRTVHYFLQMLDVTERKELEQTLEMRVGERTEDLRKALEEAERAREGLATVFRSISDGLIVTDVSGRIAMMNALAQEWLRVDSSALGISVDAALPGIRLQDSLRVAIAEKHFVRFELELNQPSRPRVLSFGVTPMFGTNEAALGAVTVIEDITHFREAERTKDDFINFAAHELRTPLTSIRGYAELLVSRELPEERRKEYLCTLLRQSVQLANLVNDLLDLARLQQGNAPPLKPQAIDLALLCREMIGAFKGLGGPHQFEVEAEPDPFPVSCESQKIQQVLQNLLSNSRKYSPEGTIRVRLSRSGAEKQNALIEVLDEGIGMTRDQLTHVFDRFYRADTSNTRATGTGLGMSIVKAIVEQHGGTVRVESELKKGTHVTIELPGAVRDRALIQPGSSNMTLRMVEDEK